VKANTWVTNKKQELTEK